MCAAAVAIDLTDTDVEQEQQVEGQAIGHEADEAEAEAGPENNVVDSVVETVESEATETAEEPPATTRAEPTTTQEPPATSTFEHDLLVQIRDQESRVSTAEYSLNRAKEEVKECREAFDGEVATMRRLIRQREEKHPLFDSQPVAVAAVVKVDESEQTATPATAQPRNPDDNTWRETPIENLSIPETLVGKLMQAGIEDIGGLADWSSSGKRLIDIAGVGAAKATKIEEAMDEFWKTWQWAASEREEVAEVAGEDADVATDEATDEATEE